MDVAFPGCVCLDMVEHIDKDDPRQVIWAEMIRNLAKRSTKKDKLRTDEELKQMEEEHRLEALRKANESLEGPTGDCNLCDDESMHTSDWCVEAHDKKTCLSTCEYCLQEAKDKQTAIAITPIDIWGPDAVKEPGSNEDCSDDDDENVPAFPELAASKTCPQAQ